MPIEPEQSQLDALAARAARDDVPVVMLNLNRYRDREEYLRYGVVAAATLDRIGARVLWRADAAATIVGTGEDEYDEVIAVWYPSFSAFLEFAADEAVVAAFEHRRAGLERAAVICCEASTEPHLGVV